MIRIIVFISACISLSACALCSEVVTIHAKVVGASGDPIENASVAVAYQGYQRDKDFNQSGKTDSKGMVTIIGKPAGDAVVAMIKAKVTKEGYYESHIEEFDHNKLLHAVKIVMLKKINPIPLHAKRVKIITPVLEQKLGYDFKVGDWVKPHGLGETTDVYFECHYKKQDRDHYDYQLAVSFPNDLDGLQTFNSSSMSKLASTHQAPASNYISGWKQTVQCRPDAGRSGNRDATRNYWMRVRTSVKENGEVATANYVKIYGDFPSFTYYFNPVPNDRNLEFNPKANLFKSLDVLSRVHQP